MERENMERANEATLAIKEKENERKWEKKSLDMQKKIDSLQAQHQVHILHIVRRLKQLKLVTMITKMKYCLHISCMS